MAVAPEKAPAGAVVPAGAAASAEHPAPKQAAPETITGTVADGRSVLHDGRYHGPGTVLEFTPEDHAHFLRTGFLRDPRVPSLVPGTGPMFTGAVEGVVRPV